MKLKKYNDFISESVLNNLLLESNIIFSDKMKKILSNIDHPIKDSLMDIENKDIETRSNYFDVSVDKNDTLTFIPDNRAQEILSNEQNYVRFVGNNVGWLRHTSGNNKIFTELGYKPSGDPYQPNSSEIGVIISRAKSETSGRTYALVRFGRNKGAYNTQVLRVVNPIDFIWSKNRQELKIGRAVRSLLTSAGSEFTDSQIEEFVNLYKATMDKVGGKFLLFEIVEGDRIPYWYDEDNYKGSGGTLGSSCMSDVPSSYFNIYEENPDVCKLIILKSEEDDSKIVARALLWKLTNGKLFMDRIYTNNDSDVNLFREYAKENNISYKNLNNSSNYLTLVNPDGSEESNIGLTVQLEDTRHDEYPYMDTLKWYNPATGILTSIENNSWYFLEDTDGGYLFCDRCNGSGEMECSNCDGEGETSCGECGGDGTIIGPCSECDGSGEIYNDEDVTIDCIECDGSGEIENECDECDGDGSLECGECYGRGTEDCWECN